MDVTMATSTRGTCGRCGGQCTGNYCKPCQRDKRFGNVDSTETHSPDVSLFACTQCGTEYETDGSDDCPDCGSSRRRFAGDL
mgnify:CR=1 FL=1